MTKETKESIAALVIIIAGAAALSRFAYPLKYNHDNVTMVTSNGH